MLLLYITTNSINFVVGNLAFLIYKIYLIYHASSFLVILKWTFLRLNIRKHMTWKNLKYFLWLCNISIHLHLYKYILVKLNAFLNVANQLILIITPECLKVLKLWEILSIQEFLHARINFKTRTSRKVNSLLKITYSKYSSTAFILK